ncbi:MAG: hypothetical protein Kow0089_09900 [Desulfobulbaceae bacterium]
MGTGEVRTCLPSSPAAAAALLILLLLAATVSSAAAGDTAGCHCFRDRTYNAEKPAVSDGYLLATTFNSLLADEFNVSKRRIIMMKMSEGTANEDLVTALYLSRIIGDDPADILKQKKNRSWRETIYRIKPAATSAELDAFKELLLTDTRSDEITAFIIDSILEKRFGATAEELDDLRNLGLSTREKVLAYTLSEHTSVPVSAIVDSRRRNGLSWSEIAHNFGLELSAVGKLLETSADQPEN